MEEKENLGGQEGLYKPMSLLAWSFWRQHVALCIYGSLVKKSERWVETWAEKR